MTHENDTKLSPVRRSRATAWGWLAAAALVALPAVAAAEDVPPPSGVPAAKPPQNGAPPASPREPEDPGAKPPAKGDPTTKMGGEYRELNGHSFITPQNAASAMMNGSFAFSQGGGVYKEGDHKLFVYGQEFLIQIGILNRAAVDLKFGGTAAVGGSLDTLLSKDHGALVFLDVGGMPKARIWTWEKIGLQLSAGVGVRYERVIQVAPGLAIDKVLKTGSLDKVGADLFQQGERLQVAPTLMLAYGIGPFGAQLSQALDGGAAGTLKETRFATALHLALDLRRVTPVPFALAFEYEADYGLAAKELTHTLVPGLFYTGRRDLSMGAVVHIDPPKDGSVTIIGELALQYFF